ncbi:non-heme iron oxygenase ferredoxin subunit [Burkholderia multivorans]|uniref:non-heme iron oxygenase ferredoxin subunit n=1 Tax=Burkholderia multivorans TaxID=87883 RepID=UPI0020A0E5AB|nr:non-heme iron oxygenase ferredoxin subunit [Burkholderia multivorans]MCO8591058.1 non-heme iron oxygenase ferredoxin subunit [Burkholderia multivorans]MCO8609934.1 non-heme iron oxygenase ferredoxin subunit [Burkholderia multivorans]MCO8633081.1 non-heme iron oxygenase ferredoxin subunit [Burkholderia multivorans]MCO8640166.1 non-heme iron oxygenase ferredoxin subunit [Burkholderia multivorans]
MTQWIDAVGFDDIDDEDVVRFDHDGRTYAIYRIDGHVYASDGMCTHERVHLADGLVIDHVIECPKHNGRFDVRDGRALSAPACERLRTYRARIEGGRVLIEV